MVAKYLIVSIFISAITAQQIVTNSSSSEDSIERYEAGLSINDDTSTDVNDSNARLYINEDTSTDVNDSIARLDTDTSTEESIIAARFDTDTSTGTNNVRLDSSDSSEISTYSTTPIGALRLDAESSDSSENDLYSTTATNNLRAEDSSDSSDSSVPESTEIEEEEEEEEEEEPETTIGFTTGIPMREDPDVIIAPFSVTDEKYIGDEISDSHSSFIQIIIDHEAVLLIILGVVGCIMEFFACYAGIKWYRNKRAAQTDRDTMHPGVQLLVHQNENKNPTKPGVDNQSSVRNNAGLNLNDEMLDIGRDLVNYGSFNLNIVPNTSPNSSELGVGKMETIEEGAAESYI